MVEPIWVQIQVPGEEEPYYWNFVSGETTWKLPESVQRRWLWSREEPDEGRVFYRNVETNETRQDFDEAPEVVEAVERGEWTRPCYERISDWPFDIVWAGGDQAECLGIIGDPETRSQRDVPTRRVEASERTVPHLHDSAAWIRMDTADGKDQFFWNYKANWIVNCLPTGVVTQWRGYKEQEENNPYHYYHNEVTGETVWELPGMNQTSAEAPVLEGWLKRGSAVQITLFGDDEALRESPVAKYNGVTATVDNTMDDKVVVRLADERGGHLLTLAPEELEPLPFGTAVQLHGLQHAELNGTSGVVIGMVKETFRYQVRVHEGEIKSIRATNLMPKARCWDLDQLFAHNALEAGQSLHFVDRKGAHHDFHIRLPTGFYDDVDDSPNHVSSWPLLVFLHGNGGGGFFTGKKADKKPGVQYAMNRFIIVSPSCRWRWTDNPQSWVCDLVQDLIATAWVNANEVFMTGVSMGGMGCWEIASARPNLFAAIAPIAAYHKADTVEWLSSRLWDMPIHAVTSRVDTTCPPAKEEPLWRRLIDKGNEDLVISNSMEYDHTQIHEKALIDTTFLYDWFLYHSLKRKRRERDDAGADCP